MPLQTKSKIYFFFQKAVQLRDRTQLKKFIESVFLREGKELESLNYIFCSDSQLRAINKRYLQHDYFTDIVTFELSGKNEPVAGEVYISVDRVRDNARALGLTFREELHRVIFHGALHLCGYKDKTQKEIGLMRTREDQSIRSYFRTKK